MAGAKHFEGLECWQLARDLKIRLYAVLERPNVAKDFRYVDQLRDAAASAPRNIAEGFGRRTNPDFLHYLDIARGSLDEIQNHLLDGVDRRHIDDREYQELRKLSERALGAVSGLQRYLRRRRRPPPPEA